MFLAAEFISPRKKCAPAVQLGAFIIPKIVECNYSFSLYTGPVPAITSQLSALHLSWGQLENEGTTEGPGTSQRHP